MKVLKVTIKNFKSIRDITIPLSCYEYGVSSSWSTFFVGINESGKSAILEAISLISKGLSDIDYMDYCFKDAQEENEYIEIYADFEIENLEYWRKQIIEKLDLEEAFVKKLFIKSLIKIINRDSEDSEDTFELKINDDLPFYEYIINSVEKQVNARIQVVETIEKLSEFNSINEEINQQNAKTFLKDGQQLLTKEKLEEKIVNSLKATFNNSIPKIQIWRSSPQFLINESINLQNFKEDPSTSIPLKNIFLIYGKKSDEEISETIERALSNQARCDELQDKMSDKVTKYINRIWKEHKIKIKVSINSNNCQVLVEDKDKKYAYYKMNQRSDGFKQFISLILSLSAQNECKKLKNTIILIDEPEVHLHPSGVRYMRDEILQIGKNNTVIVSTHSHYMIDIDTPERHWIVSKEKSETRITQLTQTQNFFEDSVISAAFGFNIFKELLPKNILIVEGNDDKNILTHSIKLIENAFFCSIKPAGGASKMPGFARLFNEEKIPAFILLDSDKEGRDQKKVILKNQNDYYSSSNVFTLKDILPELPSDCTIEDILPFSLVKQFFEKEVKNNLEISEEKAIIIQIKNQVSYLKANKQKLDSLKLKLSHLFCEKYKDVSALEDTKRLTYFVKSLIKKISEFKNTEECSY